MRWWAPVPDKNVRPQDWPPLVTVASTVLGEAEGEDREGKRLVAYSIMHRVWDDRDRWPKDPGAVCLQSKQFSCWNDGSPRLRVMLDPMEHVPMEVWQACFVAATEAMFKLGADYTGGANHYLNEKETRRIRGGSLPSWFDEDKVTVRAGGHTFLRL